MKINCSYCDKEFERKITPSMESKSGKYFCSAECWYQIRRKKFICKQCNKTFYVKAGDKGVGRGNRIVIGVYQIHDDGRGNARDLSVGSSRFASRPVVRRQARYRGFARQDDLQPLRGGGGHAEIG